MVLHLFRFMSNLIIGASLRELPIIATVFAFPIVSVVKYR